MVLLLWVCAGFVVGAEGGPAERETIWRALPLLPAGNAGAVAGILGDRVLIVGGTTWADGVKHWRADVLSFSLEDQQWHTWPSLHTPVAYAAFGCNTRGLYWVGGGDGFRTSDALWHAASESDVRLIANTGHRIAYAGAAVDEEAIYVVGGTQDIADLSTASDRVLRIDLETGDATMLPKYPGGGVILSAVVRLGSHILVFGGARYEPDTQGVVNVRDAYVYSFDQAEWRKLAPLPWARRGMASCRLDDEAVLIGGGFGSVEGASMEDFAADMLIYRPHEDRYVPASDLPYAAMGAMLLARGDELYLAGGEDRPRQRSSAFYQGRVKRPQP